eukprot:TRINITY_DN1646_c0_g1_i1.p2 TRINITY_DN1646_c0_g1~~TRINITY_DN1646_c0_g1_i1.p2  ORF type:complete len:353 (+),score=51.95 TRINITY_DN1646_c0_g1_i1:502-1560(+)
MIKGVDTFSTLQFDDSHFSVLEAAICTTPVEFVYKKDVPLSANRQMSEQQLWTAMPVRTVEPGINGSATPPLSPTLSSHLYTSTSPGSEGNLEPFKVYTSCLMNAERRLRKRLMKIADGFNKAQREAFLETILEKPEDAPSPDNSATAQLQAISRPRFTALTSEWTMWGDQIARLWCKYVSLFSLYGENYSLFLQQKSKERELKRWKNNMFIEKTLFNSEGQPVRKTGYSHSLIASALRKSIYFRKLKRFSVEDLSLDISADVMPIIFEESAISPQLPSSAEVTSDYRMIRILNANFENVLVDTLIMNARLDVSSSKLKKKANSWSSLFVSFYLYIFAPCLAICSDLGPFIF